MFICKLQENVDLDLYGDYTLPLELFEDIVCNDGGVFHVVEDDINVLACHAFECGVDVIQHGLHALRIVCDHFDGLEEPVKRPDHPRPPLFDVAAEVVQHNTCLVPCFEVEKYIGNQNTDHDGGRDLYDITENQTIMSLRVAFLLISGVGVRVNVHWVSIFIVRQALVSRALAASSATARVRISCFEHRARQRVDGYG